MFLKLQKNCKILILDTKEKFNMDIRIENKINENGKTWTVKIENESIIKRCFEEMQRLFDFDLIKTLFKREDYNFIFDALNGISGPYGIEIFHKIFQCTNGKLW